VRAVAVSPDGRWVASGSRGGDGVKVWRLGDGGPALEVPSDDPAWGVFSPDGRWLATSTWQECRVWSVGAWKEGRRFAGQLHAFSPDGALAAVSTKDGAVTLVDVEGGREYARLEDPNQDRGPAYFSPDGAIIVTVCDATASIHVWDLRLIRRELAGRGLDWELPPYPPTAPVDGPLRVTMVGPEGAAGKAP
jgi:WD40 repeat protein